MKSENNCSVLSTTDDSHVIRQTPLDIKRRELKEAKALAEPEQRKREDETSERRQTTDVRPLGGVK